MNLRMDAKRERAASANDGKRERRWHEPSSASHRAMQERLHRSMMSRKKRIKE